MSRPRLTTLKPRLQTLRPTLKLVGSGMFTDTSRASRHARGYGSDWVKLRQRILTRDNGICQACLANGIVTLANHVDHIKPKAEGGSDAEENLQSLCQPCHDAKTRAENAARWGG